MPQFLSRWLDWYRTRPTGTKAVIVAFTLLAAVLASPVLRWVTTLALIAVVIALIARSTQRTPARHLVIAAVALLAAFFVFDALASAVYGPSGGGTQEEAQQEETTETDTDSQPLELAVSSPSESTTVDLNTYTFTVEGTVTPADAEVIVNGVPIGADSDGSFSDIISLDLGKNEIEITAMKGSERAEYSRVITRESSAGQKAAQEEAKEAAEQAAAAPPEPTEQPEPASEEQEPEPEPPPKPEPEPTTPEPKPEPEPEPPSLYGEAVVTPLPRYTIAYTSSDTDQRLDVFVATKRTTDKPRLGRILVDLWEKNEADLVTAFFCAEPGEAACVDTLFAVGYFASTPKGKEFMEASVTGKVGEAPYMRVQF